jgi:hypothetical protein
MSAAAAKDAKRAECPCERSEAEVTGRVDRRPRGRLSQEENGKFYARPVTPSEG